MNTPGAYCQAELRGTNDIWCLLPIKHTGMHQWLLDDPCRRCGGREEHTSTCPTPEVMNALDDWTVLHWPDELAKPDSVLWEKCSHCDGRGVVRA